MAESTLALSFDDLMRITAERAMYGYYADQAEGLSANEETEINLYVEEAYREFIVAHDWKFLHPIIDYELMATVTGTASGDPDGGTTLTATTALFYDSLVGRTLTMDTSGNTYTITATGGTFSTAATTLTVGSTFTGETSGDTFTITATGDNRLPDDFGGLNGDVYFEADNNLWAPLRSVGVAQILHERQKTSASGRPTMYAIGPLSIATTGQRFDIMAWRTPDANYTLKIPYNVLPDALTTGIYPYGGAAHAETLKAMCLAAMERSKMDTVKYQQEAQKMLALSIRRDSRLNRAGSLGFLAEGNMHPRGYGDRGWPPYARYITVGGVRFP